MTTRSAVPIRLLELRHAEIESLGTYADGLPPRADLHTVRAWRDPLPADPAAFDGIVAMGGPMGANDGTRHPWIDAEITFLRHALAAGVPVFGVCLGSQLLAAAAGAAVTTGPTPEIGICSVEWTEPGLADSVWKGLSDNPFNVMQWHYDTFDLPEGSTLLASSTAYHHQAFRLGRSYGIQFHLEVDRRGFAEWMADPDYRDEIVGALGPQGPEEASAGLAGIESDTGAMAAAAMTRWVELISADRGRTRTSARKATTNSRRNPLRG